MALKYRYTFLVIAVVYMFFNSFLLPEGLLYTALMAPFMLLLLQGKGVRIYAGFLAVTVLYTCIHWPGIAFPFSYIKSFVMLQLTGIFVIHAYYKIQEYTDHTNVFKILGSVNLLLLIISCCALAIPPLSRFFWYTVPISPGIPLFPRLKMLTYEASYYSLIIFPVFAYYLLKVWLLHTGKGILFYSLLLSLLLGFSIGVWGGILLAVALLLMVHFKALYRITRWKPVLYFFVALFVCLLLLYFFYPDNPLYQRVENILSGRDTSARGRTYEAFSIAVHIARMKSLVWGIGLGQLKEIGRDYIIHFYHYSRIPDTVRIPNAVAETINIFGLSGLILRFMILGYLFYTTRVWNNYYRFFLFIFMFIYQFTGSFIFNVAEYIIWCLAFSPCILPCFQVADVELQKHTCHSINSPED